MREKIQNKLLLVLVIVVFVMLYSPSLKFFANCLTFRASLSSAIFRNQLFQQIISGIPSQYQTV